MTSPTVKNIENDQQFQQELANAGNKLVVVDFFATWYERKLRIVSCNTSYQDIYTFSVCLGAVLVIE